MTKRRATKEEIELQKLSIELPKIGITMVAFFATASALILRLTPTSSYAPEWILKVVYFIGIAVTVWSFNNSYNFIGKIVSNVVPKDSDDGHDKKIDSVMDIDYKKFKESLVIAIVVWVVILVAFVAFA